MVWHGQDQIGDGATSADMGLYYVLCMHQPASGETFCVLHPAALSSREDREARLKLEGEVNHKIQLFVDHLK